MCSISRARKFRTKRMSARLELGDFPDLRPETLKGPFVHPSCAQPLNDGLVGRPESPFLTAVAESGRSHTTASVVSLRTFRALEMSRQGPTMHLISNAGFGDGLEFRPRLSCMMLTAAWWEPEHAI